MILPNIRVAALGGAFLTLAIVMGEFTIASLALFNTFPTYIQLHGPDAGVSGGGAVAHQLRDHLGRDARRCSSSAARPAPDGARGERR